MGCAFRKYSMHLPIIGNSLNIYVAGGTDSLIVRACIQLLAPWGQLPLFPSQIIQRSIIAHMFGSRIFSIHAEMAFTN